MFVKLSPVFVSLLSRAVNVISAAQLTVGASVVPVELKAMYTTVELFVGLHAQSVTVMDKLMLFPPLVASFLMNIVLFVL
jgi:hypothetical protein